MRNNKRTEHARVEEAKGLATNTIGVHRRGNAN